MKFRRCLTAVVVSLIWVTGPAHLAQAASTTSGTTCSARDFKGDPRLGPAVLPTGGPVGLELLHYDRFGGLRPNQFLKTYWDPTANGGQGGWRYPPANGFAIGPTGDPIAFEVTLPPGQRLDRYGSEFGSFLSPAGLPYASRSIPPQSLDNQAMPGGCNYHVYVVVREFKVLAGPIAPAFGQRGYGLQYLLVSSLIPGAPPTINIMWLLENGYIQRVI